MKELTKIRNTIEKITAVKADQLAHSKIDLLKIKIFFFPYYIPTNTSLENAKPSRA